ncbi:MAG: PaaI family thioesterase [Actinomycetota bacterium]|nr:PaaI family thioesterase [Actinomycetota bacterium]
MTTAYPPPHHLLWDLRLRFAHDDDNASRAWMPVTPEVCGDDGSVRAGALTTLVDVISGGLAARAAQPNWIATADLTLHMTGRAANGEVEARARVLRAGRTTVVLEIDVVDERERTVAVATSSFAVLPRRDINPDISERTAGSFAPPDGAALRVPYADQLGIRVLDAAAGVVEVPVTDWSRNSMGAFQGGAVGAVLEAAAEAALRTASNSPLVVTDLHVTYLSFGRVGPLQTRTEVLAADADRGVATVALFDTGAEMRTTTTARVVATRSLL